MEFVLLMLALAANVALGVYTAFFKSYEAKTGEIVAIQNNLETVIEQNRAVTQATEDIRKQISNEHREWQIKKDVAWETSEKLATLVAAVAEVCTRTGASINHPEDSILSEDARMARQKFDDAHALFGTTRFRVKLAFGKEINTALQGVEKGIKDLGGSREAQNRAWF